MYFENVIFGIVYDAIQQVSRYTSASVDYYMGNMASYV